MTKWEYCEVQWHQQAVTVTRVGTKSPQATQSYNPAEWHSVLARLGEEGWELVSVLAPDYWYYFKRPLK